MIKDSLQVDDPSNFGVPISSTNKKFFKMNQNFHKLNTCNA